MKRILYTGYRSWGNEINFFNKERTKISGWYPEKFDNGSVIISNPKDKESELFLISNIKFCDDPTDMFFADIKSLGNISKDLIYGEKEKLHEYIYNITNNDSKLIKFFKENKKFKKLCNIFSISNIIITICSIFLIIIILLPIITFIYKIL